MFQIAGGNQFARWLFVERGCAHLYWIWRVYTPSNYQSCSYLITIMLKFALNLSAFLHFYCLRILPMPQNFHKFNLFSIIKGKLDNKWQRKSILRNKGREREREREKKKEERKEQRKNSNFTSWFILGFTTQFFWQNEEHRRVLWPTITNFMVKTCESGVPPSPNFLTE